MRIENTQIRQMEKRRRAAFVNCLSGMKSLNIIGTKHAEGGTNAAIVNSAMHLGSDPPLLGYIARPNSVERHTVQNILDTGFYTFNAVVEDFFERAHKTSARYPQHISEFEVCGLSPDFLHGFAAPAVKESPLKIGLRFREKIDIALNGTHLIIGEVEWVEIDEKFMDESGWLNLPLAGILAGCGLDGYVKTSDTTRLPYAKFEHP